jgi:hypothetical protein
MPDPDVNPVLMAQNASLITPDDAQYLNRKADELGVDLQLVGQPLGEAKKKWSDDEKARYLDILSQSPQTVMWLQKKHNTAMIQDELASMVAFREAHRGTMLPDPADVFDIFGAAVANSGKRVASGLAAVATAPWMAAQAVTGEEPTVANRIIDYAGMSRSSTRTGAGTS